MLRDANTKKANAVHQEEPFRHPFPAMRGLLAGAGGGGPLGSCFSQALDRLRQQDTKAADSARTPSSGNKGSSEDDGSKRSAKSRSGRSKRSSHPSHDEAPESTLKRFRVSSGTDEEQYYLPIFHNSRMSLSINELFGSALESQWQQRSMNYEGNKDQGPTTSKESNLHDASSKKREPGGSLAPKGLLSGRVDAFNRMGDKWRVSVAPGSKIRQRRDFDPYRRAFHGQSLWDRAAEDSPNKEEAEASHSSLKQLDDATDQDRKGDVKQAASTTRINGSLQLLFFDDLT
jgi:hypothetical protein